MSLEEDKVLKANGARYVVRVREEEVTPGGIMLAHSTTQKVQRGVVVTAGAEFSGVYGYRHLLIRAGEEVLFLAGNAHEVPGDSTLRVVNDSDVLGVYCGYADIPRRQYDARIAARPSKVV